MNPLRACELCGHHQRVEHQLYCTEPAVRGPASRVPCEEARSRAGGCGWNAERLLWPTIGCDARRGRAIPIAAA